MRILDLIQTFWFQF